MTKIPDNFARDDDPFTAEDGRGDDVDGPLPDVNPADFADTPEAPTGAAAEAVQALDAETGFGSDVQ